MTFGGLLLRPQVINYLIIISAFFAKKLCPLCKKT